MLGRVENTYICIFDSARIGEYEEQGPILVRHFLNFRDEISLQYSRLP